MSRPFGLRLPSQQFPTIPSLRDGAALDAVVGPERLPSRVAGHAHLQHVKLGAGVSSRQAESLGHVVQKLEWLRPGRVEVDAEADAHDQVSPLARAGCGGHQAKGRRHRFRHRDARRLLAISYSPSSGPARPGPGGSASGSM